MNNKFWVVLLISASFFGVLSVVANFQQVFPSLFENNRTGHIDGTERLTIIQDNYSPIDVNKALEALLPDIPLGEPIHMKPSNGSWANKKKEQIAIFNSSVSRYPNFHKFAVFSLDDIPCVIHLGQLLKDTSDVRYFQFDRKNNSFHWPKTTEDKEVSLIGLPSNLDTKEAEIIVRVSVSAPILPNDTEQFADTKFPSIDLVVDNPSVFWLENEKQVFQVGDSFREILDGIRKYYPGCKAIHLFYAGPTPIAIRMGQQINPNMNPKVITYQYKQSGRAKYSKAIVLND